MDTLPVSRKPALRRSPRPDSLFAADLPLCASVSACNTFILEAKSLGWESLEADGWIHLRKTCAPLPPGLFPAGAEGEASCLETLFCRHPGSEDAGPEIILLMKARESGPRDWEAACRSFHRELARRLRTGEPFPDIPLPEKEES